MVDSGSEKKSAKKALTALTAAETKPLIISHMIERPWGHSQLAAPVINSILGNHPKGRLCVSPSFKDSRRNFYNERMICFAFVVSNT